MKRVFAWIVIFLIPLIIVLSRSYALPLMSAKAASNKEMQNQGETIVITEKEKITSPGMEIERTTTIYTDYEGKCEVRHIHEKRNITMLDQVEESEQVLIRKDGWVISYYPKTKKGNKMKDPSNPLRDMTEKQKEEFAKGITDAFGATTRIIGEEKIAGKNCVITETVTKLGGMEIVDTTWIWTSGGEKIVLKSHSKGMGTETLKIATSVQEGIPIDKTLFVVPDSIKISFIDPFKY